MKNNPFSNPFKCSLKSKNANNIIVNKRIEIELDPSVLVKKQNGEMISINDLQERDRLEIIVSPIAPYKVIEIELLPPLPPKI